MKIRLMGTEDECRQVAGRLASIVDVLEVSEPRANRGASKMVRVYVECRVDPGGVQASEAMVVRELDVGDLDGGPH
jgi:hypothetical protein